MGAFVSPLTGGLDAALTNYAKRFQNNALIADIVAPRVLVPRQSGKYWTFGREDQNILQQTLRAPGAPAQLTRRSVSSSSFFCDGHALKAAVTDEDAAYYQAGDLMQDATQTIVSKLQLDRENALATAMTDTAQVTNNTTLAGTAQWSDYGNSNPESDVETGLSLIRQAGVQANFMAIGEPVYKILKNHPAIKARYAAIRPGSIGAQQIAEVFGVDNVLIARAVSLDKANAVSFVWGKNVILGYVDPGAGFGDVSGAKTFMWGGNANAGLNPPNTDGSGFGVMTYRDPDASAKTSYVSVEMYYKAVITAVETLYLIKSAVA